jgi:hypothetical protein
MNISIKMILLLLFDSLRCHNNAALSSSGDSLKNDRSLRGFFVILPRSEIMELQSSSE